MIVDIEKAKEAIAALEEAEAKCEAAGLSISANDCRTTMTSKDDAVAVVLKIAKGRLARAEHRALPIAIGDTVRVGTIFNEHNSVGKIVAVGPRIVRLAGHDRTEFRVDTGRWNSPCLASHYWIDEDDLHRIKRDLVPKNRR